MGPTLGGFQKALDNIVYGPVYWFRQKFIEPAQGESFPWYHRRFNRVPGIEECYTENAVCREEANHQFKRDWLVEEQIVHLLRERMHDCFFYEKAAENYYIKYGEVSRYYGRAEDALAKQKHRIMWERRHGPVGTGMKEE